MPSPEISHRVEQRLDELYRRHRGAADGRPVQYYTPGRGRHAAEAYPGEEEQFAISVTTTDGELYQAGDHDLPFALQSVSKVFSYGLALEDLGREEVLRHVGVEPSGDAFNSIVFDERSKRPFNPMVNAGALVTTDLVRGRDPEEKLRRILESLRTYSGNPGLEVHQEALRGELLDADNNRATLYLMRGQGMISGDVEAVLKLYLQQCSVHVTTKDLSVMGASLANGGINPLTGARALARDRVRDVLSVMYTCGMYDFAGEWAFEVGVPAKSGVSGAILCVIPGKLGLAVFSPGLDPHGNSVRGIGVCKEISERLGLHVFATEAEDAMLGSAPVGVDAA